MKKLIGIFCAMMLVTGTLIPFQKASAESNLEGTLEKTVQVVLYSDDTRVIMSEVPKEHVLEYRAKLENPAFRNSEIQKSVGPEENLTAPTKFVASLSKSSISPMAVVQPPDGGTKGYVRYMTKNDILRIIDSIDNTHDWPRYFSNPVTDSAVAAGVAVLTKIPNFAIIAATATAWSAADLANRQTAWWKDSAIMIWRGKIKGVKLTVKPNTTSNYPAAYITLVRY
ncbi:hypothetical protein [Exiguobacterium sp. E4787]|uniref:hypothetical protein n=1 Tax=Exiguobacterium sp. E4787 TaxID=2751225 RepID=UPI001BEC9217|nr:hypothetical protein [Exiguobacterium sp. E4787]